jgi:hypothetical protein
MASPQTPQLVAYLAVIATRPAYGVVAGQRGIAMLDGSARGRAIDEGIVGARQPTSRGS